MDQVLTYMYLTLKKSIDDKKTLKRDYLNQMGENIELFPGVFGLFKKN